MLSIGQTLQNRYRIQGLLGQGGMGAVYLAEDLSLGRRCAIKENVPDPNASQQVLAQMRQQFQAEARILANLDHPNLPRVNDYFSFNGNEYIVMDYIEGENLHSLQQRQGGPLPEQAVLVWADQVLDALAYLHGQQPHPIIHRDIKPANIILTPQGKVKLVDFGLVKLLDPNDPRTATVMKGMGTPKYAPLEQYAGGQGHTDARTDIYSLGGTLYHLLTGVPPADVHQRILDPTRLAPPRRLNPALSPHVEASILKALEVHPRQRFQSAREMRQVLTGVQQPGATLGPPFARPPQPVAAPGRSRLPAWLGLVAGLGVVLVLLLIVRQIWFGGAAPPAPPLAPVSTPAPATSTPHATPTPTATIVPEPPTQAPNTEPTALPAVFETKNCPAGSPSLTIWADDQRADAFYGIADQLLSETGVCLNVQEFGFGDIRTRISLAGPAGKGPDIFVGAHDWLGELAANGVPVEMDLGNKVADFDPVALKAFTYDGKLVGLPYAVESVAFICNSDLVPTPPTTYGELKTMAKEMQDAGTVKQFFALMGGDPYHQEPVNTAFGGYIFGQADAGYDACAVGLDSRGAIDYLTWIDGMVKDGLLSADVDWETAHVLFETGDAACIITGPWALDRFLANNVNYSINAVPGEADAGSPFVGVQGFMINAFSPNKVLAQAFLTDYVATNAVMEPLYTAGNRPPAYLPARDIMDADAKAFSEVAASGHPMPAIPAMSAVWDAWGTAITSVFMQSETPEEAAANAARQVRSASGCQ